MLRLKNSPIRLLVAILGSVGTHGWTVINSIKAGTAKVRFRVARRTSVRQSLRNRTTSRLLFWRILIRPPSLLQLTLQYPSRVSLVTTASCDL